MPRRPPRPATPHDGPDPAQPPVDNHRSGALSVGKSRRRRRAWTGKSRRLGGLGPVTHAASAGSEQRGRLVEDDAQDLLDLVEVLLVADERGSELDDRVAAVVGAAVEALVVERLGEEAAQQLLGLLVVEGLLGVLVLDQLDAVEVPVAADVADDRQVLEALERRAEGALVVADVLEDVLVLEDVAGWPARPRSRPGGRRRCSRGRTSCRPPGTAPSAGRRRSSRRAGRSRR